MGQFVHDGILYEELPNGQARVIGPAQGGPVFGPAKTPGAQTPDQATGQSLQNVHTQLENQTIPLQQANTKVNIAQGQASIASTNNQIRNTNLDNVNNLRKQFETEQSTQDYKTVLPLMDSALKIQNNKAGDLNLVYAFGKAMDPGSVVREGEQVMATNVGGVSEKVKGYIDQINGQGQLTPVQRTQLIEELRNRSRSLQETYNQRRAFYEDFAKRNNINPNDVVGPHPGQPYQGDEAAYIQAHGGTPKVEGAPLPNGAPSNGQSETPPPPPTVTEHGWQFQGVKTDGTTPTKSAEDARQALFGAMQSGKIKSPADIQTFMDAYNQSHQTGYKVDASNPDTIRAIQAAQHHKSFNVELPLPNISDVRGGVNTSNQDAVNSTVRGVLDTPTYGTIDKLVAGADTLFKGGPMDYNLSRQYAISDYDQEKHPYARFAGQVIGGGLMPLGEMNTPAQVIGKSAAAGTAYGMGSSRSLGDVPQNALMGGVAGAAGAELLGAGFAGRALAGRNALGRSTPIVPPLVDPQTGQLNQPLEAMTPGQRVVNAEEYGINLPADAAGGRTAAVIGKGLDIMPGSAGVMEDARRATESQVAAASDVAASRFGDSRTMNEAGSELQRGANERIERGKSVIGRAYDAIPISPKAPTNLNNTKATLDQLAGKLESNPDLQQEIRDPKLLGYLDALNKHGLSWQDLKDFRTFIGDKIGEFRFSEDARTGDYRSLYAALSEDMRNSAAAQGPGALRAFERANTLNRQNEQVIDGALTRLLGKDGQQSPEKAAAAVQAMTKGGKSTGDLRTLAQIRSATIKSGAWNEIASTLIRMGGQPANSPGRDFNPQTFVHWYADMSEPARAMLFGNSELRKSLDGFVAVNQRLQKVNALRNTSQTAGNLTAAGTVGTMAASLADPSLGLKMVGIMAGNFAMAKAWTNPAFVRLITGYSRAVASGNQNAVRSQIGRIGKLATTNPELREPLIALQQRLLSGANDNAMLGATASQSNSEEN